MGTRRSFRFAVQAFDDPGSGQAWAHTARRVEALGYSTLFGADHYYGPGQVAEVSKHRPTELAPISAMAMAAAATFRLRVGCRVFNVEMHHPVVLAKEMATLDLLTDGRVEVGLGAGWTTAEFEALGKRFDPSGIRIARLAEAAEVIKAHWSGDEFRFDGEHFQVHGFAGRPVPSQSPHPPIMIGGGRPKVLRTAGRLADIVSLNFDNGPGRLSAATLASCDADATTRQLEWVREGAGERFDELEIELSAFFVNIGRRSSGIADLARRFEVGEEDLVDNPHALLGSVDVVCDVLRERRERYGISYVTVPVYAFEDFAPVVARLAGT